MTKHISMQGAKFFLTLALYISAAACSDESRPGGNATPAPEGPQHALVNGRTSNKVQFVDITQRAGIDFHHETCATGEKFYVETMGAGCALLDYDNDGFLDLYAVNGSLLPGCKLEQLPKNALYRSEGNGRFTEVTDQAGVGDTGYGQGVTVADYDNDGDQDVYVVNFGPNVLYRNNGDGTFTDVTAQAGVGDARWGIHAAFADFNVDGYLDLFVANYLDFSTDDNTWCGRSISNVRAYCHPDVFNGVSNVLYLNLGDGRFKDVTKQAGVDAVGKGMGVVVSDLDNDGDSDIYVTNDAVANFLFRNRGDMTFEEVALVSGCAFSEDGKEESSMGVDFGDLDNDGDLDLVMTSLDYETNTLYANQGDATFTDVSFPSGFGESSLLYVGFAALFVDYDLDMDLDILVANGHVIDNINVFNDSMTWEQRNFLYDNDGTGRFKEVGLERGAYFSGKNANRGLTVGDVDNDGDLDLFLSSMAHGVELVRNDGGNANGWISVRLVGTKSNRDAIGARLTAVAGEVSQMREVQTGRSYESHSDLRQVFGLGIRDSVEVLEIRWPSGDKQVFKHLAGRKFYTITEGSSEPEVTAPGPGFRS